MIQRLAILILSAAPLLGADPAAKHPADHLPPHIKQITWFGERAEFSLDGKTVYFLSKQFGDVMAYDIETSRINCVSQHFKHHGFNRVFVLSNGDLLLTGPDQTFDVTDKTARLKARHYAKMFVLDKSLSKPPVPLGQVAAEGPAVSRHHLKIAWTHHIERQHRQTAISMGDLVYEGGVPALKNIAQVLTVDDFPQDERPVIIETQNFVPPNDEWITVSSYRINDGANSEGFLFHPKTRELKNFTRTPDHFEEIEGVFPDGLSTTVERNEHKGKAWPMVDAWRVWFDGSREPQRLTHFLDFPGFKATNYVVSDDGQFMAFQIGISGDEAGVGYGLFLYDFKTAESSKP